MAKLKKEVWQVNVSGSGGIDAVTDIAMGETDEGTPAIRIGENIVTGEGGGGDCPWEYGTGDCSAQLKDSMCVASGQGAVASGIGTHAGGTASHTEGGLTATRNDYNEEEETGYDAAYSHAEGLNNATNNVGEHAEGKYGWSYYVDNHDPAKSSIHYVGIGTNNQDTYRKNAEVIMGNGDKYMLGVGGYDGKNIEGAKTVQEVINGGGLPEGGNNGDVLTRTATGGKIEKGVRIQLKDSYTKEELVQFFEKFGGNSIVGITHGTYEFGIEVSNGGQTYSLCAVLPDDNFIFYCCDDASLADGWYTYPDNNPYTGDLFTIIPENCNYSWLRYITSIQDMKPLCVVEEESKSTEWNTGSYTHYTFLEIPGFACFNVQFVTKDPEELTADNFIDKLSDEFLPIARKMVNKGITNGEFALSGYAYMNQGGSGTYTNEYSDETGTYTAFLYDDISDICQSVNKSNVIGRTAISFNLGGFDGVISLGIKGFADSVSDTSGLIVNESASSRLVIPFSDFLEAADSIKVIDVVR